VCELVSICVCVCVCVLEREGGEGVKASYSVLNLLVYLFENSVDPFMAYFSYFVKSAI
jgi:hypothetical protein